MKAKLTVAAAAGIGLALVYAIIRCALDQLGGK
jgi:hypothetical protein